MCLYHVDHAGIVGIHIVADVDDDFIVKIINDINCGVVDIVQHVQLMMAFHDVGDRLLQRCVNRRADVLSVMPFVLFGEVMIR